MESNLSIPYVVEESCKSRPLNSEMEKAILLCLAYADLRKPLIFKGGAEEIDYIAKVDYPIWITPWADKSLVADGMASISASFVYIRKPDATGFTEDLIESRTSLELFRERLKGHVSTFSRWVPSERQITSPIIHDESITRSFMDLLSPATPLGQQTSRDASLLPINISKEETEKEAKSYATALAELYSDIQALQYSLSTLKEETRHHREKLSAEIEQTWESYEVRISSMKRAGEIRAKQIIKQKEGEARTTKKFYESRLQKILAEKKKLESAIDKLKQNLEKTQLKQKYARRGFSKRTIVNLSNRIRLTQEKIKLAKERFQDCSESEENVQREWQQTLEEIEKKFQNTIAKENEKLEILNESRNLEISDLRRKIDEIDRDASAIESGIAQLVEEITEVANAFEGTALPLKVKETMLIGIPLCIVGYRTSDKTRNRIFPPVVIMGYENATKRIQKALLPPNLRTRLHMLMRPRSPRFNDSIFRNLEKIMDEDLSLKNVICKIGQIMNLLKTPGFIVEAERGMEELVNEGWMTASEKEDILRAGIHKQY